MLAARHIGQQPVAGASGGCQRAAARRQRAVLVQAGHGVGALQPLQHSRVDQEAGHPLEIRHRLPALRLGAKLSGRCLARRHRRHARHAGGHGARRALQLRIFFCCLLLIIIHGLVAFLQKLQAQHRHLHAWGGQQS